MKIKNCMQKLVPKFKTVAGQSHFSGTTNKNNFKLRIDNTNDIEVLEYCETLINAGFNKVSENFLSSGSEFDYHKNLFFCFAKQDLLIYVFFVANCKTLFITIEKSKIHIPEKFNFSNLDNVVQTITQISIKSGMCYAIQIKDGSYILIDGGVYCEEDEKKLLDFLFANSKHEKPLISTWFFTHAHVDHVELATKFVENYHDKIDIKSFAYLFPYCGKRSLSMENPRDINYLVKRLERTIKKRCPNADVFSLHTGQKFVYNGLYIDVIYSADNSFLYPQVSVNGFSAAFRINSDSGKIVTLLGDCMCEACRNLLNIYGDFLKSDILQVAHHGLIGGDKKLYQTIDPDICLWPTTYERFTGKYFSHRFQWCLGEGGCDYNAFIRDDSVKKRVHYSHGEIVTLEI